MQSITPRIESSADLDKQFKKIAIKDPVQFIIITKKINQILLSPEHFKPLRGDLSGARRVHVDKSFVLVYEYKKAENVIRLLYYGHHDEVY